MPDNFEVEPNSLRHVGRVLNQGAEEGRDEFAKHHSRLTSAAAGLFDRSRSALDEKADSWRTRTDELATRVDDHGSRLHTDAALYESTDGQTSAAIYFAGERGQPKLNLKA